MRDGKDEQARLRKRARRSFLQESSEGEEDEQRSYEESRECND